MKFLPKTANVNLGLFISCIKNFPVFKYSTFINMGWSGVSLHDTIILAHPKTPDWCEHLACHISLIAPNYSPLTFTLDVMQVFYF